MMVCDLDTICVTLKSVEGWARSGDMPDTQAHFEAVAARLKNASPPPQHNGRPAPLFRTDMTRAASELGL